MRAPMNQRISELGLLIGRLETELHQAKKDLQAEREAAFEIKVGELVLPTRDRVGAGRVTRLHFFSDHSGPHIYVRPLKKNGRLSQGERYTDSASKIASLPRHIRIGVYEGDQRDRVEGMADFLLSDTDWRTFVRDNIEGVDLEFVQRELIAGRRVVIGGGASPLLTVCP